MKPKFCPACGKETEKLYRGLCEKCRKKKEVLATIPEKIKIRVCKDCGKLEGADRLDLKKDNLRKIVEREIEINGELRELKIEKINKGIKNIKLKITVSGKLGSGVKKEEVLETTIQIKERLCETCGKIRGGYYEGVIQIRSEDIKKAEKVTKKLMKMIDKGGHITKVTARKNGFDIYMSPKKIMNRIVGEIKNTKEIKRSYSLVTKKDGKDLYRNTVLVRL